MHSVYYIRCSNFGLICVPEQRIHSEDQVQAKTAGNKRKDDKSSLSGVGAEESNAHQKRNKKRKRKEVKTFGLIQLNWALLVQRERSERNSKN